MSIHVTNMPGKKQENRQGKLAKQDSSNIFLFQDDKTPLNAWSIRINLPSPLIDRAQTSAIRSEIKGDESYNPKHLTAQINSTTELHGGHAFFELDGFIVKVSYMVIAKQGYSYLKTSAKSSPIKDDSDSIENGKDLCKKVQGQQSKMPMKKQQKIKNCQVNNSPVKLNEQNLDLQKIFLQLQPIKSNIKFEDIIQKQLRQSTKDQLSGLSSDTSNLQANSINTDHTTETQKMIEPQMQYDSDSKENGKDSQKKVQKQKPTQPMKKQQIINCKVSNSSVKLKEQNFNELKNFLKQQWEDKMGDQPFKMNKINSENIILKQLRQLKKDKFSGLSSNNSNLQTKFPYIDYLKGAVNMIKPQDRQSILDIFQKRENISQILDAIGMNAISQSTLTRALKKFGYQDKQKLQRWFIEIFEDKLRLSDAQFFKRIRFNSQTQDVYQTQKERWLFRQYFNQKQKLDQQAYASALFKKIIPLLKEKSTFQEKDRNYWSPQFIPINLGKKNGSYSLFTPSEQVLPKDKRQVLMQCLSSNDVNVDQTKNLKECYFLAAMACLADKYPQLIYSQFELLKNPAHLYSVKLINGKQDRFYLDLQFPLTNKRRYFGAKPYNSIIWPMLLEKAFAKNQGSYDKLSKLSYQQSLTMLTGWSFESFQTKKGILAQIQKQLKNKSMVTCSGYANDKGEIYLYTVQQITGMKIDGKQVIMMRNYFRDKIWRSGVLKDGFWRDQPCKKINLQPYRNDGIFYMSEGDFLKAFATVEIWRTNQQFTDHNNQNNSLKTINQMYLSKISLGQK